MEEIEGDYLRVLKPTPLFPADIPRESMNIFQRLHELETELDEVDTRFQVLCDAFERRIQEVKAVQEVEMRNFISTFIIQEKGSVDASKTPK